MITAIIVVVLNTAIACGYLIISKRKKKEDPLFARLKTLLMIVCPVIGPLYIGISYLCFRYLFSKEVDLADVIFKKDRVKTFLHADEERGRTMVSMEEALTVTDKGNLRNLMMNVVRGDIQNSLASISMALNSDDSETSHYAASVLQDALNDFRTNVQKCMRQIEKEDENRTEYILMILPYLNQVLQQQVFTELEQKTFVNQMDQICEILYETDPEQITSRLIENVCMRLLEIRSFDRCERWCERAVQKFPGALSSYTCRLKLYFTTGDRDSFLQVLDALRESNVVIDNETLEMIRVFL